MTEASNDARSKMSDKEQKEESHTITTMGNIERVNRLASDTAGLMTLYYKEQIQSLESEYQVARISPYSDEFRWITNILIDVTDEKTKDSPPIIVADYITAWIIHALKVDRDQIRLDKPLPLQLWYLVAKKDPIRQTKSNKISSIVTTKSGEQYVPLANNSEGVEGDRTPIHLELHYFVGCVSIVGLKGEIYQYPFFNQSTENNFSDLDIFGYVYITPFTKDEKIVESIIKERGMIAATRNRDNDIITKVRDIEKLAKAFIPQGIDTASESYITKEIAKQVATLLRVQNTFVNGTDVKADLDEFQERIILDVDIFKEEIRGKIESCQTCVDAVHEQIQRESAKNREAIEKDNELRYNKAIGIVSAQMEEMKNELKTLIGQRMNEIEAAMLIKMEEISIMSKMDKDQCDQALNKAIQAAEASEISARASEQSHQCSEQVLQKAQIASQEMQSAIDQCQTLCATTIEEKEKSFERNISEISTRHINDLNHYRKLIKEASDDAKESANETRGLKEMMAKQIEMHKAESRKLMSNVNETRRECERLTSICRETEKHAKQGLQTSTEEYDKVEQMFSELQRAIQRVENLERRYRSKE